MPTISTTILPDQRIFPFVGLPENIQDRSDLPRAELRAEAIGVLIPQAGAGNDRRVVFNVNAPQNFSYVLAECTAAAAVNVAGATTNANTARAFAEVEKGGTDVRRIPMITDVQETSVLLSRLQVVQFEVRPAKEVFLPDPMETFSFTFEIYDSGVNDDDLSVDFYCRLLQYDVNQTHHVAVNSPTLTR